MAWADFSSSTHGFFGPKAVAAASGRWMLPTLNSSAYWVTGDLSSPGTQKTYPASPTSTGELHTPVSTDGTRWYLNAGSLEYRSTDGLVGEAWETYTKAASGRTRAVPGALLAFGGFHPKVLRSTNGGDTWVEVLDFGFNSNDAEGAMLATDHAGNVVILPSEGGNGSSVWFSSDSGATWTAVPLPTISTGFAADTVAVVGGTIFVRVDDRTNPYTSSYLIRSSNLGASWTTVTSQVGYVGTTDGFYLDCGYGKAVVTRTRWNNPPDNFVYTADASSTFTLLAELPDTPIDYGVAVGPEHLIAWNYDTGDAWIWALNGWASADQDADGVSAFSLKATLGGEIASSNTIARGPTALGVNWTLGYEFPNFQLSIFKYDRTIMSAGYGGIYRSEDDGVSWHVALNPALKSGEYLFHVKHGAESWVALGSKGSLFYSFDGGENWVALDLGVGLDTTCLTYCGGGTWACFSAQGQTIWRSQDDGRNWVNASTGVVSYPLNMLIAGSVWITAGEFGRVSRSADGGETWTLQSLTRSLDSTSNFVFSSGATDGTTVMVAGESALFRSVDAGVSWVEISTLNTATFFRNLMHSKGVWFLSGQGVGVNTAVSRDVGVTWDTSGTTFLASHFDGTWAGDGEFIGVSQSLERSLGNEVVDRDGESVGVVGVQSAIDADKYLTATLLSAVGTLTPVGATFIKLVNITANAGVASVVSSALFLDADASEKIVATPWMLSTADQFAALVSLIHGVTPPAAFDSGTSAWVMNAKTGGFTRYEGFDFNSYAKIGGRYYGCTDDGIYQLDGDTDNGEPIRAMVSFGKQNFGTSALKRITNAYVGTSGEGKLFLKIIAEGEEYIYAARSYDENIRVQRFDTGKGLRVNWLEFELYNADGEDFELASVEFAAVPLSRRI